MLTCCRTNLTGNSSRLNRSSGGEHRTVSKLRHHAEGWALAQASSLGLVSAESQQKPNTLMCACKTPSGQLLTRKAVESVVFLIFPTIWTEMTQTAHFCWDKAVSDSFLTMLIMKKHLISALRALCPPLLSLPPPTQYQQNKGACDR